MSLDRVEIERMTHENVADAAHIEQACFSSPWSLAALKSELTNATAVFYVARINGAVSGYAGMHHVVDEGYITNIAVLPRDRRRGVARALLKRYFAYARENSLRIITLEVRESNAAARALYEKMDFYIAGRRKGFYSKPVEDGIIMTVEFKSPPAN